jgi:hypothetical protein
MILWSSLSGNFPPPLYGKHRYVVGLFSAVRESVDFGVHGGYQIFCGRPGESVQFFTQARFTEQGFPAVGGFGHSVGVKKESINELFLINYSGVQ